MRFILSFILFITLSTPALAGQENFDTSVEEAYQEYVVLYENENSYYRLKVVEGINDDKVNYGVYLFNLDAKSHSIVINNNDINYTLKADSRGDYSVIAFDIENDVTLNINDTTNNSRYSLLLVKRSVEDFNARYDLEKVNGLGLGTSSESLSIIRDTDLITILVSVFVIMILIFGLIMLFLFVGKKGIFNPKHRTADVFSYKKFLEEYGYSEVPQAEEVPINEQVEKSDAEPAKIVNMYPYQREYDDEDDEKDVKAILRDKGFITDYLILPEEEKNVIMLELMKMRDTNEISRLAYQKEVVELWKK